VDINWRNAEFTATVPVINTSILLPEPDSPALRLAALAAPAAIHYLFFKYTA
jgi:hypothetical protein